MGEISSQPVYKKIADFEAKTAETNAVSDKLDAEMRDVGKKVQKYETGMEETLEKLQESSAKLELAEKEFKDKDDDVNAAARQSPPHRFRRSMFNF